MEDCTDSSYTTRCLIEAMYDHGMIKTWYKDEPKGWELRSQTGKLYWTPYYINLRPLCSYDDSDKLLEMVGTLIAKKIKEEAGYITKVLGVAHNGIPISTAVTAFGRIPSCWTRSTRGVDSVEDLKEFIKSYGDHNLVEGEINDGDVFCIVDDVLTRAGSKLIAKGMLEEEIERQEKTNVICNDVIVVIDREDGGEEVLREQGIVLYSLAKISECVEWLKGKMHPKEYEVIRAYYEDNRPFQSRTKQEELEKLAIEQA